MKIAIGSEHGGFHFKEAIKEYLRLEGHDVQDLGTYAAQPAVHYPLYIRPVSEAVAGGDTGPRGAIGGSGNSEADHTNRGSGGRRGRCATIQPAALHTPP